MSESYDAGSCIWAPRTISVDSVRAYTLSGQCRPCRAAVVRWSVRQIRSWDSHRWAVFLTARGLLLECRAQVHQPQTAGLEQGMGNWLFLALDISEESSPSRQLCACDTSPRWLDSLCCCRCLTTPPVSAPASRLDTLFPHGESHPSLSPELLHSYLTATHTRLTGPPCC